MNSQKSVRAKSLKYIKEKKLILPGEKVCVAVSGGADSICLIRVLSELRQKLNIEISACHFNHRLRGVESDEDQKFVENFCAKRGIRLLAGCASEKNKYKSENEAREARYAFFQKILAGEGFDKIAIAHNLNDSAETVLLRTIRGSGYRGLKSIPALRGKFCRPLLSISREEIESYLSDKQIKFRLDSSNDNLDYSRNVVRHQILPELAKINPNIVETLGNTAVAAEEDYSFLSTSAAKELVEITTREGKDLIELDRSLWLPLHPAMKRLVIRLAIEKISSLLDVSFKQVEEVIKVLEQGEGKKFKPLPHSLRIELKNGKIVIIIYKRKPNETK